MFAMSFENATTVLGALPVQVFDAHEKEAPWFHRTRDDGHASDFYP